jgi:glycosyltransferase involved in cell wall biosynthesis
MNRPLVTIVTIARDEAASIGRTLDSVQSQSYERVESIVVDGGSRDGTYDIAVEHPVNCRVIRQTTRGISAAFNDGVTNANGSHLLFLNAGDWLLDPDAIASLVKVAAMSDGIELVAGRARLLTEADHRVCGTYPPEPPSLGRLDRYCSLAHPATLVSASTFDQIGTYDPSFSVAMDYELWLRCRSAGLRLVAVDREIAAHVRGGISTTNKSRARVENVRARRKNGVRRIAIDAAHLALASISRSR